MIKNSYMDTAKKCGKAKEENIRKYARSLNF